MVAECLRRPGLRAVCIREVQKDLKDSAKLLIEDKIRHHGLDEGCGFQIMEKEIRTPGDGLIIFKGMKDYTANSIKSLEGFDIAWPEEAHTLSALSLQMLRPTIRKPGSQLWFSWNPRRKVDPVDEFFRSKEPPKDSIVVKANWNDNPWFPDELENERLHDFAANPDQYGHVWEGEYVSVVQGSYFAQALSQAKREGRIGKVARDPHLPVKAFWDIGIQDATSIWIVQWVGREIRVLDYYEAVGQPLGTHLQWLRSNDYGEAICVLPHDASKHDLITGTRFEDHIRAAGFEAETIPNQGKGAAMKRIEAARRIFPAIWFNEPKCSAGLDALGWYHEKIDEERRVGLGPDHDWSSHAADAFGLMCVAYEAPNEHFDVPEPETEWVV